MSSQEALPSIPFFGARKVARELAAEVSRLRAEQRALEARAAEVGALGVVEREALLRQLEEQVAEQRTRLEADQRVAQQRLREAADELQQKQKHIVQTDEDAILQEVGIYRYRHPLTDAVAYEKELEELQSDIKDMVRKDGRAILAATDWTVNGSKSEGRAMVRDFSKLMLRAFNAEADNLVRGLKPYKLDRAIERLEKVAATIEKLGKIMQVRISSQYLKLRERELELTADFLQKLAEEKEAERQERERLREERKVQQEIERERARLEKERQHYQNAIDALVAKGDDAGVQRLQAELADVAKAIEDVDYRAANIRAGYVYVISNIGSFGERMVKVGLTRRLDPIGRIKELSDASVPFNFDVHAVFFSKDAVGIEQALHERLSRSRVNMVNLRREFFRVAPAEVKAHLAELAGELLQFHDEPEALEYRQCLKLGGTDISAFSSPGNTPVIFDS